METGQVKTGENAADTYTKMLQEMVRVTLPVAYGIACEYPTVQKLVEGLKEKGPLALEECRKARIRMERLRIAEWARRLARGFMMFLWGRTQGAGTFEDFDQRR
jgi:hypothetical protein